MKKIALYILILIALTGIFVSVNTVNAQGLGTCSKPAHTNPDDCEADGGTWTPLGGSGSSTEYKFLAPLPNSSETFNTKDAGALGNYINLIINLVIGISAVLAVVMIVMGGIEYMGSELISSKEAGKERIQNAILGLLIALGAYALLNTINPDLLNSDINIPDAKVVVNIDDSVPQTPVNGKYKNGIIEGAAWTGTPTPLPPGITLNNNGLQCSRVGQLGCTSTIGLNMSAAIAVQNGCNCQIVITGGTEWWRHGGQSGSTSHQLGNSTVDIRTDNNPNSALNKFITGGKPLVLRKRYGPNNEYYYEGNHWHVGP